RPFGALRVVSSGAPRVALRSTRGYIPTPLRGEHARTRPERVRRLLAMSPYRVGFGIICLLLIVTGSSVRAAEPTADDIARAVKQLGDDDFETREKASRLLWSAGSAAEPALRAAVKNG